jgi:dephospho-CoA kinase
MKRPDKIKKDISGTLASICAGSETLLIGLTGGIATGKSTVAEMFGDMGAVIIDFDLIARNVVEPGRKSWKLITNFFGKGILNPDTSINRKKLSGIVFNDPFRREKLESFTHPFIWEEFIRQVEKAVLRDKTAIILAVIPLLIEGNMQEIFSKTIVVYLSPEMQLERLMARDRISRNTAVKILNAQIPIDEKVPYGDFIINNGGTIEDTGKITHDVWDRLKQIQKERPDNFF